MIQKRLLPASGFRFKPDWPKIIIGSAIVALIASLYVFRLGSLVGASPAEQQAISHYGSLSSIVSNPLLLPYKVLAFIALHLPGADLLNIRITSVILSFVSVWFFFMLTRRWYGLTTGLWTSALFATSGWMLQTGRSGTAASLLIVAIIGLITVAAWVNKSDANGKVLIVFATTAGLALFVPAGIWFVLACVLILYKPLLAHRLAASTTQLALAAGVFIVLFAGLIVSLLTHPGIIAQWVGLPSQLPGLGSIGKQAIFSVLYFILRGPVLPGSWLAHTPLLDVASTVFLLFGVIFYAHHLKNTRIHLLASFLLIGAILVALNGAVALHYLVPTVYVIIGSGVAYVLHQWNKVFPRNPIARVTAISLTALLLACIVSFHVQRYFIAWRYSPVTVEAYRQPDASGVDTPTTHLVQ